MIDAHNPVLTAIIYALLLSPLLFLGLAWTSARRNRMNVGKPAQAALVAVTVGYIFLSLSFVFRRALLGGDYSPRLYRTCQFNILLNLGLLGSLFRARTFGGQGSFRDSVRSCRSRLVLRPCGQFRRLRSTLNDGH